MLPANRFDARPISSAGHSAFGWAGEYSRPPSIFCSWPATTATTPSNSTHRFPPHSAPTVLMPDQYRMRGTRFLVWRGNIPAHVDLLPLAFHHHNHSIKLTPQVPAMLPTDGFDASPILSAGHQLLIWQGNSPVPACSLDCRTQAFTYTYPTFLHGFVAQTASYIYCKYIVFC